MAIFCSFVQGDGYEEWAKIFNFAYSRLVEMNELDRIKRGMVLLEEQYVIEKVISVCWSSDAV